MVELPPKEVRNLRLLVDNTEVQNRLEDLATTKQVNGRKVRLLQTEVKDFRIADIRVRSRCGVPVAVPAKTSVKSPRRDIRPKLRC